MFTEPLNELLTQISSITYAEAAYNITFTSLLQQYIDKILTKEYSDYNLPNISNLIANYLALDIYTKSREYIDQFIEDCENMKFSDQF